MIRCFFLLLGLLGSLSLSCHAQRPPTALLQAVYTAQQQLHQASYHLRRTDTLVSGQARQFQGKVRLQVLAADSLFGFAFWAEQANMASQQVYDGQHGYEVDSAAHTYRRLTRPAAIQGLASQGGGRLLVPDLVHLDTSQVVRWEYRQDAAYYYLTLHYADLPIYDVRHRCKVVTLARATFLPVAVERRQQTLGQVQCLRYELSELRVNDQALVFPVSKLSFVASYRLLEAPRVVSQPVYSSGLPVAPALHLATLGGDTVTSAAWRGQVVLLDFWELWCGPCQEAWPAIEGLRQRYAAQGLLVYGITHEATAGLALQRWLAAHDGSFPSLRGTPQSRQTYQLSAVPLYVLIDRQGRICHRQEGYSSTLEAAIQQALQP
jgi:thiol-disulfide isomerase/thioredoxin